LGNSITKPNTRGIRCGGGDLQQLEASLVEFCSVCSLNAHRCGTLKTKNQRNFCWRVCICVGSLAGKNCRGWPFRTVVSEPFGYRLLLPNLAKNSRVIQYSNKSEKNDAMSYSVAYISTPLLAE
jgi:hypothetical protein